MRIKISTIILFLSILVCFNVTLSSQETEAIWKNISPAADSVSQLISYPLDSNLQFAVSRNNIYRTTNGGKFWQPLSLKHVQSLAINSSGSILAVTFDGPERRLWISKNQGSTFLLIGSFPGYQIFTSPNDNVLFANGCSSWGFCRSVDGGVTWKDFRNFPDGSPSEPDNNLLNYLVQSVAFPSNDTEQMYISGLKQGGRSFSDSPFIYFTENAGRNWKRVDRQQVYFLKIDNDLYGYGCNGMDKVQNGSLQKITDQPLKSIVSVPGDPKLLWGFNDCNQTPRIILFSNDGGLHWNEKEPFFHLDVTSVSAVRRDRVLFGTSGGIYANSNSTWTRSSSGFIKPFLNNISSSIGSGVLCAISGVANYPANDGRFLQKHEPVTGWSDLTNRLNLREKVFGDIVEYFKETKIDPFESNHIVVTIGNSSGYFRTVQTYDGGRNWNRLPVPDELFIHSKVRFNPYKKGQMHFFDTRFFVFNSSDSGLTFQRLALKCSSCPRQLDNLGDVIYDQFNSKTLYFLNGKIFKTSDGGLTLKEANQCNPCTVMNSPKFVLRSLVQLPQRNSFLAFTINAVYKTTDGAAHWKRLERYNEGEIVKVVAISPDAKILTSIINVSLRQYPDYRRFAISKDQGQTWNFSFPASLQESNVVDIQRGTKENEAIVATDSGLYRVVIH